VPVLVQANPGSAPIPPTPSGPARASWAPSSTEVGEKARRGAGEPRPRERKAGSPGTPERGTLQASGNGWTVGVFVKESIQPPKSLSVHRRFPGAERVRPVGRRNNEPQTIGGRAALGLLMIPAPSVVAREERSESCVDGGDLSVSVRGEDGRVSPAISTALEVTLAVRTIQASAPTRKATKPRSTTRDPVGARRLAICTMSTVMAAGEAMMTAVSASTTASRPSTAPRRWSSLRSQRGLHGLGDPP